MRRDSAIRHRANFLVLVGPQLAEMAGLVGDAPEVDVAEAVGFDLQRMADTAERLGLSGVASRARAAAGDAARVGWRESLRAIARAAAANEEASPFGPILAIVPSERVEAIVIAAENTVERVVVFADGEVAAEGLEVPAAVILPAADATAIARWSSTGVPVIAWGEADSWSIRSDAVSAGAGTYLHGPLDLALALDQARQAAWQRAEAPVAAVLGDAGSLAEALAGCGIRVIPRTEHMDDWSPDAAVVIGREPTRMLRALRAHPSWARTAVIALAHGRVAGADEVLPIGTPDPQVIERLRGWLDRVRAVPTDRDPLTGLANRPAALRSLDRWLGWGRRTGTPLSLALLSLDGLTDLEGGPDLGVEAAVHRATASALTRTIRRLDVIGRIGPALYIAGLPNCRADEARKRLSQSLDLLAAGLAAEPRAGAVSPALGIADSAHASDRMLARAWESLALARQGG